MDEIVIVGAGICGLTLALFAWHIRRTSNPLCEPKLFKDRTTNLGLGTQLVQWLVLQGTFFVLSVYYVVQTSDTILTKFLFLSTASFLVTVALYHFLVRPFARHSRLFIRWINRKSGNHWD